MPENTVLIKDVEKQDYYLFFAFLFYTICIFFLYKNSAEGLELFDFNDWSYLNILGELFSLIIIVIIFVTIKLKKVPSGNWGLLLKKDTWWSLGIIILILLYSIWEFSLPLASQFFNISPKALFIVINELVLRVAFISFLITLVGDTQKGYVVSSVISGILSGLVMSQYGILGIGISMGLSYLYCISRSILILIFFIAVGSSTDEQGFATGTVSVLIYFALAISAHLMQKRKSKENILTSQT